MSYHYFSALKPLFDKIKSYVGSYSYSKEETDTKLDVKVNKTGDTMTGKLVAPQIETGTDEANYVQSKKFRGEGNASTYYHAVDFGYANHDKVDFHEYGAEWNFYKNTSGTQSGGKLVAQIKEDGVHAPLKGNADTATSATKATQDADGNPINTTYRKIQDSYSKTEVDTKDAAKADKATTLSGYGITDAYTKTEVDSKIASSGGGSGTVVDAYTKAETDAKLSGKADKATTLNGYGITDTYTKTEVDTKDATKADKATTISGYGITDAYTKTEVDSKDAAKADKATSLAGYGIIDAYTKTEVDTKIASSGASGGSIQSIEKTGGDDNKNIFTVTQADGSTFTFSIPREKTEILTEVDTKLSTRLADGYKKIAWSTITIATSAWSNKTATVSVSGVTSSNAVDVAPAESSYDAYTTAGIRASAQGSGTLTFSCKTVPTVAINVNVKTFN